jgi:hypothetical protein
MALTTEQLQIAATRVHPSLKAREIELQNNLLCLYGGRPYIDARLSRAPCEPETSWSGRLESAATEGFWNNSTATEGVIGRKGRAFTINYASRAVSKFLQYVFGAEIQRTGILPAFQRDATRTQLDVNAAFRQAAAYYLVCGWSWIGVDRLASRIDPATGKPTQQSLAEKEARGDRCWLTIWPATEVIDWQYGPDGRLDWLITEQEAEQDAGPFAERKTEGIRTVWSRGEYLRIRTVTEKGKRTVVGSTAGTLSARVVPFALMGSPSPRPWFFDDLERVQASILNLESLHDTNLAEAVFPQLVLPHELIETIMNLAKCQYDRAVEIARGLSYPILEPPDSKGITRYIQPNATDLAAIPNEIIRRRRELYEVAGLGFSNRDSAAPESAEAKEWNHLDLGASLRDKAHAWQSAETQAVEIARALDSSFPVYAPAYPMTFDTGDVKTKMESLLMAQQLDLPPSAVRETLHAAVDVLHRLNPIPSERRAEIHAAIDQMPDESLNTVEAMTAAVSAAASRARTDLLPPA